jgi:hypothetical protein
MTPRNAYQETAGRARALLRLHRALLNTRQRRIRKDWKLAFCRVMHWPRKSEIHRIDSADALIVLREKAQVALPDFTSAALDDVLRAALTLGVSALDRYAHERVTKMIVRALKIKRLSRRQEEFAIPAIVAVRLAARLHAGRKAGKMTRPANEIRKSLQEVLHRRPFQSWRDLEFAFDLIGINDLANQIQKAARLRDVKLIREELNRIVRRRNQIVHEGDLVRHERGGRVRRHPIERPFVERSLAFLDDLVDKLEGVA